MNDEKFHTIKTHMTTLQGHTINACDIAYMLKVQMTTMEGKKLFKDFDKAISQAYLILYRGLNELLKNHNEKIEI